MTITPVITNVTVPSATMAIPSAIKKWPKINHNGKKHMPYKHPSGDKQWHNICHK